MTKETKGKKTTVYIRDDGWIFSEDGMNRLREGGHRGHDLFMQSLERQIGQWHRVSKPLDRDAAAIVKSVKGMAARAMFVSKAIVNEAERRMKKGAR